MRSRAIREGSVGLLVLLSLGLISGMVFWIRGLSFEGQAYRLEVELPDALGLGVSSPVRFRGVKVGRVISVETSTNGVMVVAEIKPATLLIPRNSEAEVVTSGFAAQAKLDFLAPETVSSAIAASEDLSPFADNCDPQLILCDGDRLDGGVGPSFDEMIRSATKLAEIAERSGILDNANRTLNTIQKTTGTLAKNANVTLTNVSKAAIGINQLSQDSRREVRRLGGKFSNTADQISSVIAVNRESLQITLTNLASASENIKVAMADLAPFISRAEQSQLIENLDALAADGAQAAKNLNNITTSANNPILALGLVQTLDSARVTFQNAKKITTDLEEITGNPQVRQNLLKLINGLSKLLSSTQDLEKQIEVVQNGDVPGSDVQNVNIPRLDAQIPPSTLLSTDQPISTATPPQKK